MQFFYQTLVCSASLLKQKRQDKVNEVLRKEDSKWCDQFSCLHFQKVSVPFMEPSTALMLEQGVQNVIALWSAGQGKIVCPVENKWWYPAMMGLDLLHLYSKTQTTYKVWWHMPITPALWEAQTPLGYWDSIQGLHLEII